MTDSPTGSGSREGDSSLVASSAASVYSELRRRLDALEHLQSPSRRARHADELRRLRNKMLERNDFYPGQIVTWKPQLKNKRIPSYGGLMIVMEVLDEPIITTEQGPGSAYFREPIDLAAAITDEEGDVDIFWYDSRRLEAASDFTDAISSHVSDE